MEKRSCCYVMLRLRGFSPVAGKIFLYCAFWSHICIVSFFFSSCLVVSLLSSCFCCVISCSGFFLNGFFLNCLLSRKLFLKLTSFNTFFSPNLPLIQYSQFSFTILINSHNLHNTCNSHNTHITYSSHNSNNTQ
ncbi:uncharacterized protein RJT20DRAFT_43113 [Scheffersomyces xylosifermentans]|uniref:uncharacterized protein n=1 Tax=Scheffersomyces xylosifermentans TaxID=1304137 RepID=UPI00315D4E32